MLRKVLQAVFYAVYTLFLVRFLLLLGENSPFFIYTDYREFLDWVYLTTDTLGYPVESVVMSVYNNIPALHSDFFPTTTLSSLGTLVSNLVQLLSASFPAIPQSLQQSAAKLSELPGFIDWLAIPNFLFYALLQPACEKLMDWLNNIIWAFITERFYQKETNRKYQQALTERNQKLTEQQKMLEKEAIEKEKLKQSVVTDELTKVFNKRFFLEKIQEEFKSAKRHKSQLGIIMVDIDHFKKLNDTYGHLMGDKVLQKVAQAAKLATPGRAFCCRFGGEEFSIIIPGKSFEEVQAVAKEIHKQLPLLTFEEDRNLRVTCSQGVCYGDFSQNNSQSLDNPDAFIKVADDELYKAKLAGRNRVCAVKLDS